MHSLGEVLEDHIPSFVLSLFEDRLKDREAGSASEAGAVLKAPSALIYYVFFLFFLFGGGGGGAGGREPTVA